MNFLIVVLAAVCLAATSASPLSQSQRNEKQVQEDLPAKGATIEEVVLQSNLHIKPKREQVRRVRSTMDEVLREIYATHKRVKRQGSRRGGQAGGRGQAGGISTNVNLGANNNGGFADAGFNLGGFRPVGQNGHSQQQSATNAAANNNFNGGSSGAIGQSQAFQSQSGNANFGAGSASTGTLSHNGNNNAGSASHSQLFVLPNGQTVNFASSNNFANSGLNNAGGRGSAVSVSG
ncbi:CG17032 [Drosophila busckii]|uniref:CG17032 n=1 Tax=Drosophila busckii TaxID=30019 RepID=A0A0M3QWW0_DROBS|nr:CG17032 [Drosophila busckii]